MKGQDTVKELHFNPKWILKRTLSIISNPSIIILRNSDHSAIRITSSSISRLQAYPNIEDKMQNRMNSAPEIKLSLCNHGQMLDAT